MKKPKILMTYMESGLGHITSITSISDNLKKYYGDKLEIVDSYIMQEDKDPILKKWEDFIIHETKLTNKVKGLGSLIFAFLKMMDGPKFMRLVHRSIFKPYVDHTLLAFKKRKPDVIVSTHYFMTFAALEYKRKIDPHVKVITYNPDNNIHEWWDNREHLFIVNNKEALQDAISKKNFAPDRTKQVFYTARDEILAANFTKEEYRKMHNIPLDKFCVIVADGAYACARSEEITNELLKCEKPLTIIMLAGKNEKLLKKYQHLCESGAVRENITLIPLAFTKQIYEYYAAADVFVTKAGPNAILDSVFMGTPIIVDYYAHPIEKFTTKLFIDEYQVGKYIFSKKKIKQQIEQWIDDPSDLKIFAQNTHKIDKHSNGGKEAAKLIFEEAMRCEPKIALPKAKQLKRTAKLPKIERAIDYKQQKTA